MPAIVRARTVLFAPITLYFGGNGSPSGDGSTLNPFDSIPTARLYIQANYDLNGLPGLVVLIQHNGHTVTKGGNCSGMLPGQVDDFSVKVLGEATGLSGSVTGACIMDTRADGSVAFGTIAGARFSMGGFFVMSGQANCAVDGAGSRIVNTDKCYSSTAQDYTWSATNYGQILLVADNDCNAIAASYLNVLGGNITVPRGGRVVNITSNSITVTQAFVTADAEGFVNDSNTSYPGYAVYGPKYQIHTGASVKTGAIPPATPAGHFPGGASGNDATGGYLT